MARAKRAACLLFKHKKRKSSSSDVEDIETKKRKQVSDLIKEALSDAKNGRDPDYSNVSAEVQEWIVQDRKRRENDVSSSTTNQPTEIDSTSLSLLRSLPRDVLYDIIDFIPTFSTRNCLRETFENIKHNSVSTGVSTEELLSYICDPLNPIELNKRRVFDCAMVRDSSFVTFHKMRLVCREYAIRMKHKLFSCESIDLSMFDLDDFEIAKYIFAFIKGQSQYLTNKDHSDNDPLMYQCVSMFDSLTEEEIESKEKKEASEESENSKIDKDTNPETMDVSDDSKVDSSNLDNNNNGHTTAAPSSSGAGDVSESSSDSESKLAEEEVIHPLSCHSMRSLYIRSAPIELASTHELFDNEDVKTPNVKETVQYIGTNKYLKSLVICARDPGTIQIILRCCTELASLTFFDAAPELGDVRHYDTMAEDQSVLALIYDETATRTFTYPSLKTLTLDALNEEIYIFADHFDSMLHMFPNLTHVVFNHANSEIEDYVDDIDAPEKKNISFYVNGTKVRDCNLPNRGRNKAPQERVNVYFTTLSSVTPEQLAERLLKSSVGSDVVRIIHEVFNLALFTDMALLKRFMDCLFRDGLYPIEEVDLTYHEYEQKHYSQIREYMIYLANTYQNGRFANAFSTSSVLDALRLGLRVQHWDEILFRLPHDELVDVMEHVKTKYGNDEKFAKLVRAVILRHLREPNYEASSPILLNTLKYLSEHTKPQVNDMIYNIFKPVKCLFVKKDLEKVTSEKTMHVPFISYALAFSNYLIQPSILNFISPEELLYQNENGDTCLHCFLGASSDLFLDQILAKQPKLAQCSNKQNRGIVFMFEDDVSALFRLAKYFNADLYQVDILGKRPAENFPELLRQVELALSVKPLLL
nr:unnamed protein product [Naegleria fowleri]